MKSVRLGAFEVSSQGGRTRHYTHKTKSWLTHVTTVKETAQYRKKATATMIKKTRVNAHSQATYTSPPQKAYNNY